MEKKKLINSQTGSNFSENIFSKKKVCQGKVESFRTNLNYSIFHTGIFK
jgi:hypothetical protein